MRGSYLAAIILPGLPIMRPIAAKMPELAFTLPVEGFTAVSSVLRALIKPRRSGDMGTDTVVVARYAVLGCAPGVLHVCSYFCIDLPVVFESFIQITQAILVISIGGIGHHENILRDFKVK